MTVSDQAIPRVSQEEWKALATRITDSIRAGIIWPAMLLTSEWQVSKSEMRVVALTLVWDRIGVHLELIVKIFSDKLEIALYEDYGNREIEVGLLHVWTVTLDQKALIRVASIPACDGIWGEMNPIALGDDFAHGLPATAPRGPNLASDILDRVATKLRSMHHR
jgi:hypothetical protein